MTSVSAFPLASLGTRRTGPGVVTDAQRQLDRSTELPDHTAGDADDFHSTPALPPVSRSQQASVLAASFLAIAITIGYNQCYGVFQEYYRSDSQDVLRLRLHPGEPRPSTAMLAFVGTLGAGLTWAGSIFVNPWLSRAEHAAAATTTTMPTTFRVSPRGITLAGVALMALGFLLASLSTQVWHLLLTQGLLYGIGSSMLYFPLLGPAPEYFTRHRATALGIILSGGGFGSLVLTPAVRALLSAVGGRWTLRFLAALDLAVGLPVAWAVPPSRFPSVVVASDAREAASASASASRVVARRRTHVSAALLTTPAFLLSVAAAFCQSAGAQLPLTFIPSYSVALGLSAGTGATLLAVSNAVNAAARVATGYAGDRFGRLNVLAVSLAGAAIAVGVLWGTSVKAADALSSSPSSATASSMPGPVRLWMAFIVLYSVAAGGYYALFPATIADVFGIRSYAAVNGFIYFIRGCGTMLGSPVGGVLLGSASSSAASASSAASSSSYADVVVWDGALLVGSTLCVLGVRWADALRRGWAWRA